MTTTEKPDNGPAALPQTVTEHAGNEARCPRRDLGDRLPSQPNTDVGRQAFVTLALTEIVRALLRAEARDRERLSGDGA